MIKPDKRLSMVIKYNIVLFKELIDQYNESDLGALVRCLTLDESERTESNCKPYTPKKKK